MPRVISSANSVQKTYVLDSFALIAYFFDEPGAKRVQVLLNDAEQGSCDIWATTVNVGELLYKLEREKSREAVADALVMLRILPIQIAVADLELTRRTAHIKAWLPIAYADCYAIALAQRQRATVVTGDPEFRKAEELVSIEWLEKAPAGG
jgi:predicted nucleic acid-binding protein